MADGHDLQPWKEWLVEIAKWALAGIAALGSSAALFVGRRYRTDSERLDAVHTYVEALKKRRAIRRLAKCRTDIRELKKHVAANEKTDSELRDLVRTNNNKIEQYEATCKNLISLVELRGKEHHEHRDQLQSFSNRLTIVETHLNIKHDWKHAPS